jgi:hypothetical protein
MGPPGARGRLGDDRVFIQADEPALPDGVDAILWFKTSDDPITVWIKDEAP